MIKISPDTKAIVWDLDGTIINSLGYYSELMKEIAEKKGLAFPARETVAQNYHGKVKHSLEALLPEVDSAILDEIEAEFYELTESLHENDLEKYLFADAVDLASRVHDAGLYQVIVSNRVHEGHGSGSPKAIIMKPPLRGVIDIAVCGDDNAFHKPDPRVLAGIMEKTGFSEEDFVVIGDQFVDAQLAKNLGANAVLVNRNDHGIPHLERLGEGWEGHVTIVSSLGEVST